MARIDGSRGVWKAPAGTEADIRGVSGVEYPISDPENGFINLGPAGAPPCAVDLDNSQSVDFGDVSAFLTLFALNDLTVDFDNSGALDFGDVSAFLGLFAAGCP